MAHQDGNHDQDVATIAQNAIALSGDEPTSNIRTILSLCLKISPNNPELRTLIINFAVNVAKQQLIDNFSDVADSIAKETDPTPECHERLVTPLSKIAFARSEKEYTQDIHEQATSIREDINSAFNRTVSNVRFADQSLSDDELYAAIALTAQEMESFHNHEGAYTNLAQD